MDAFEGRFSMREVFLGGKGIFPQCKPNFWFESLKFEWGKLMKNRVLAEKKQV